MDFENKQPLHLNDEKHESSQNENQSKANPVLQRKEDKEEEENTVPEPTAIQKGVQRMASNGSSTSNQPVALTRSNVRKMAMNKAGAPNQPLAMTNPAVQVQQRLQGKGENLSGETKGKVENALGADMTGVKIHTSGEGNQVAQEHNARALTVGKDIAFASGEYKPGTMEGDALLLHEAHHTLQQKDAAEHPEKQLKEENPHGNEMAYEKEADDAAVAGTAKIWGKSESWIGTMAGKTKNAMKTGLSLQRCGNNTSKPKTDSTKADTAKTKLPFSFPVPGFFDLAGFSGLSSLKDIATYLTGLGFSVTDYKLMKQYGDLKGMVMKTMDYLSFVSLNSRITYEEAQNASLMKLFDLMKGKTPKGDMEYVMMAVKEPSKEETHLLDPAKNTANLIKLNPKISRLTDNIQTELNVAKNTAELKLLVKSKGEELWKSAVGTDDDRSIYWGRIKIRKAIREHSLLANDLAQMKETIDLLEETSRGRTDITFSKAEKSNGAIKKILVTGFDPFQGGTSNPSGILAQKFDGMILTDGKKEIAEVQSMTFTNSYSDFDDGVVEKAISPYLTDPKKSVYMVLTISLDNAATEMYMEKYAANTRAGWDDNEGIERYMPTLGTIDMRRNYSQSELDGIMKDAETKFNDLSSRFGGISIPKLPTKPYTKTSVNTYLNQYNQWVLHYPKPQLFSGSPFPFSGTAPEFIETNFPIGEMMTDKNAPKGMTVRQSYSYFLSESSPYNKSQGDSVVQPGANAISKFNKLPADKSYKSIEGPGGDYFSNEIYYRVSWMRQRDAPNIKNLHLHIPKPGNNMKGQSGNYDIGKIFSSAKEILTLAVKTQAAIDASKPVK